jgi:hypothetical protein
MQIEVGKKYRIDDEHINNNGSCLGISSDEMKERFPGNIVEVVEIRRGIAIIAGYYELPVRILLPLEEVTKRQKDIKLLKESEKKWAGIVYDGKKDCGWTDCSCCSVYYSVSCSGCPIGNTCKGIGYTEWRNYEGDNGLVVFDAKSEELALNVLSSIGDIRRKLEKEEQDSKEHVDDSLECYEYVVNGKPTGIKVGEYLQLQIGEVESGKTIPNSTLITLESPYSVSCGRGLVGIVSGFIYDGPDVLREHFKRNDDDSIRVFVY